MTQQVRIRAGLTGEYSVAADLGSLVQGIVHSADVSLADGSGLGLASDSWSDNYSVSASTNSDIDLQALTKPTGAALALTGVKALLISAGSANPGNLTLQLGASNGWTNFLGGTTPTHAIQPGGVFLIAIPSAAGIVVASNNKTIRIASAATTGTYTFRVSVVGIV